jgi:hypothetical protein
MRACALPASSGTITKGGPGGRGSPPGNGRSQQRMTGARGLKAKRKQRKPASPGPRAGEPPPITCGSGTPMVSRRSRDHEGEGRGDDHVVQRKFR